MARVVLAALVAVSVWCSLPAEAETRYLAFQVFTGSPDLSVPVGGDTVLGDLPSPEALDKFVAELVARIGTTGTSHHRLAVIFGPIAFDHSDADVARFIASAFDIAIRRDIAIGFHIDDSMYWSRQANRLGEPENIERAGWKGPPSTGRRLDWGPRPSRAPPQLCLNSPIVEAEVRRRGKNVIGAAIHAGIAKLVAAQREDLFAGVIAGWETQIGRDYETGAVLGFCAITNRGLGPGGTAAEMDDARIASVEHFVSLWSDSLAAAGIPATRIYSHIAFFPREMFQADETNGSISYAERTNFAPSEIAFGLNRRGGFSTYPFPGLLGEIADQANGKPWASAEGANVALGGEPGDSGMSTETYLAQLFDRGAVLVNVFGWGVGPEGNGFRQAAERDEALAAYAKFLRGEPLVAGPVVPSIQERLPPKIRKIQTELPGWVTRHGGQDRAQPLVDALDAALRANDLPAAEAAADALIKLIDGD